MGTSESLLGVPVTGSWVQVIPWRGGWAGGGRPLQPRGGRRACSQGSLVRASPRTEAPQLWGLLQLRRPTPFWRQLGNWVGGGEVMSKWPQRQ